MQTVIIGLGAIGRMIVDALADNESAARVAGVLVGADRRHQSRPGLPPNRVHFS